MEDTGNVEIRERLRNTLNSHLAPIEHLMIGSNPSINGEVVDVIKIIEAARTGDSNAFGLLLTPDFLQKEGLEYKSIVVEERIRQRFERKMRGLAVIDAKVGIQLDDEGIEIFCEPSDLDEATGQIVPEWKIYLLKGDEIVGDSNIISRLRLSSEPNNPDSSDKIFTLEFSENNHALLKLHI